MNDIQFWKNVLKAQNPELISDTSCYLKTKELYEDLIKYFIIQLNNKKESKITEKISSKNINSKIIPIQHAKLISKWIDKSKIPRKSYEFKLILRGSWDGFSASKFHEICDNQSHTISIIKVKDTKELYEDLIKYFIIQLNNKKESKITEKISSKNINSKIIPIQHAKLISKWIDKSKIPRKSYEFKLILRGSWDGFSASKFHEICDNQSHTISIIKVKDSNEILGGYNLII
ncbi:hypothetical protein C1645_828681 [Glomus cerebriforme]|uniref:TLDc domain-containing protein n=1 Tax=Glomus cerebriforme TaxID=658196 RepID=A0A397SS75_9GLOM|nr:hypothetical protein C1645_828681 [Glomus cerebriforme]